MVQIQLGHLVGSHTTTDTYKNVLFSAVFLTPTQNLRQIKNVLSIHHEETEMPKSVFYFPATQSVN